MNALGHIRQLDYTVIYARDLPAMRRFYEKVMDFPVINVLSETWIEFGIGANRLALTVYGGRFKDVPPPAGNLSLQLAFRVPPAEVAKCAELLEASAREHPGHARRSSRTPAGAATRTTSARPQNRPVSTTPGTARSSVSRRAGVSIVPTRTSYR